MSRRSSRGVRRCPAGSTEVSSRDVRRCPAWSRWEQEPSCSHRLRQSWRGRWVAELSVMPLGEPTVAAQRQPERCRRTQKNKYNQRCTEGQLSVGQPTVYGGSAVGGPSVYHGVRKVYGRRLYHGVRQVVRTVYGGTNSVRQATVYGRCTAGNSLSVYGRCTAVGGRCTAGVVLRRCPLRLVSYSYLFRRLVSGWCFMAKRGSPWPLGPGYHLSLCHETTPPPQAQTVRALGRARTCPSCLCLWSAGLGYRPPAYGLRPNLIIYSVRYRTVRLRL